MIEVKRMIRFDGEGSLRAYCDLAVGNAFLIKGLRVVEGKNGLFVTMPRQQGKDTRWYDNVSLMNAEVKAEVSQTVLTAYRAEE